ncbi:glycosyltransferase [Cyanobium sp. CH-040]|uniref:glycosyltransferase n=1 Tax=Cyanobium sp. CH-040 TaxID=2823708 RepID=UPI0020CD63F9|nr:glycosyltransferase [Cyanobium sp. CH-040]MCP9928565.1 glycosyltransferase [Cyanobium sp. CH-040]
MLSPHFHQSSEVVDERASSTPDFKAAYLQDGNVYLVLASEPSHDWLLEVDDTIQGFEPCARPRLNFVDHQLDLAFDQPVVNADYETTCSDWTEIVVSGEKYCVVQIKERGSRLAVPVISDWSFSARIVGNRSAIVLYAGFQNCEATVRVSIASADGEVLSQSVYDSNSAYRGGQSLSDFQLIEHKVSRPLNRDQLMVVTVEVVYVSFTGDEEGPGPLIILSSPQFVQRLGRRDRAAAQSLLHVEGASSFVLSEDIWLKAPLPVPVRYSAIRLRVLSHPGAHPVIDQLIARTKLRLIEDHGHSIKCRAPVGSQFLLRINGVPAKRVSFFGKRDQWISIPSQFLSGRYTLLDFQDLSGSLSCCQVWLKTPEVLTNLPVLQNNVSPPYPDHLSAAQSYRFRALCRWLESDSKHTPDRTDLARLIAILDQGPVGRSTYEPIEIPTSLKPLVSIIIPCHNQFAHTYCCLASIALAWSHVPYEVILVDDGSDDETTNAVSVFKGIKVLRNETPQRFIKACHAGARVAQGDYLVLLNNDTEVTVSWLDQLLEGFRRFPRVGVCGAKLLYPSGILQDAGGIVWNSGNPWNYGRGESPHDPRFRYARQADYLSGAALMISREAWDQVGGLSSYLEPMYFEDTDLSFKVRASGYTTWYIPSATVFHYEGATSGTDISDGFKAFQEVNRPKFKRKWSLAFKQLGAEGEQPDLVKDRNISFRVLFVDDKVSMPDKDAGSFAAVNEIQLLQSFGAKVTFLPANLAHFGVYVDRLERQGVEVITAPFYLSLETFLLERAAEFDLFYVNRYDVAQAVNHFIRRSNPSAKIILNLADLHYLRLLRSASSQRSPEAFDQAMIVKDREVEMMKQSDLVLSYSSEELAAIDSSTNCQAESAICPWFVRFPRDIPHRRGRNGMSFVGSYLHHPNVEGIQWFCHSVMPLLEQNQGGQYMLHLYGSRMPQHIKELSSGHILAHGYVEDVSTVYTQHAVFVAPLLSGAGVKGKVINALAFGIPTVLSPCAAEGIGLRDGFDCLIARSPDEWRAAITALIEEETLWNKLSANSREFAKTCFSYSKARRQMCKILEKVEIFVGDDQGSAAEGSASAYI